jgi:hypothetical protein
MERSQASHQPFSRLQFFVFTGVLTFLLTMASLFVYVFMSGLYADEQKKFPLIVSCRRGKFFRLFLLLLY